MVTTPEATDPGLSREDQAEAFARNAIAGHPQGAVRRGLLYLAVLALILTPWAALAVIPLFLLATTDQLA